MTLLELARKEGKAKVAIAARVDGVVVDLARPLSDGAKVEWVLPADPDGVEILRHSTAHVMAAAVKELFPGALITIGPAIENGFYYDFDVETPFTPEDLVRIGRKDPFGLRSVGKRAREVRHHAIDPGGDGDLRLPFLPGQLEKRHPCADSLQIL
ncbi:MAG TPA: hypothetical protein VFB91_06435 [Terriglobales bacterium]|nr:hypothetical protein [Terriglobales bacterium]